MIYKKLILFLFLFFLSICNVYADGSFSIDMTSDWDLKGNTTYKIWDITFSWASDIDLTVSCWDNDYNSEIRLYLEWTDYFIDCKKSWSNWYITQTWTFKNVPAWSYSIYWTNNMDPNWNWWFWLITWMIKEVVYTWIWWTGSISQSFLDLDLSSFNYEPEVLLIPDPDWATPMINYSKQFENTNKILYEIKILLMVLWLFHLFWIFYTIINDLLWKK